MISSKASPPLVVFSLWLSLTMLGCAGGRSFESKKTSTNPISVSASDLVSYYEANEIAADRQYKNRTVIVTGTVDHVGKDITDSMYVTLKGDKEFGIFTAQCFFDDSWAPRLSTLRAGDTVTVSGRCDGKFGNVIIRDCSFP